MEIPKTITKNNKQYKLIKEYEHYILYENIETGVKEGFCLHDLGLLEEYIPQQKVANIRKNIAW